MKFKKSLISFLCILIVLFVLTGMVIAEDKEVKVEMKISGSAATVDGNQTAETFKMFEHLAELYSDWEIDVKIYPAGTFGGSQEAIMALRNGEVHMFNLASNNFAVHAASIWPFSFPYMFESYEHIREVVESPFGEEIQERALKQSGVRIVGYPYAGWRAISNSVKPIKTIEDLEGMKIRVPKSPTIMETFRAWGVNPTPIGWEETFTALQQGVADGFDNPVNVIGSFGFYEVQDYVTTLKYQPQICVIVVNEEFWQSLSSKHKAAIQRALDESITWCADYVKWAENKYTKVCKENGMEFYDLPPEEEARWEEAAKSSWTELYELADKEWTEKFIEHVEEAEKRLDD